MEKLLLCQVKNRSFYKAEKNLRQKIPVRYGRELLRRDIEELTSSIKEKMTDFNWTINTLNKN